eukprot:CAMPEP_0174298918 /NCGR_PEP_ID=MMETSP0809-20121228/55157_1 /TAXON_ID=73025 ORGANISM="Eutreptiella gymnastica-like, Strain CCMP1594" /NCGR_SAMPLE_ID=MMETSP0809 /ASSEMBLY_ACC=CAM_ASM_000658 /LENGTH=282 /DNA_ID=CAMNT_0015403719 /DNA_START=1944 /DNA_END=2789 /DNA_ORIENTATION=-
MPRLQDLLPIVAEDDERPDIDPELRWVRPDGGQCTKDDQRDETGRTSDGVFPQNGGIHNLQSVVWDQGPDLLDEVAHAGLRDIPDIIVPNEAVARERPRGCGPGPGTPGLEVLADHGVELGHENVMQLREVFGHAFVLPQSGLTARKLLQIPVRGVLKPFVVDQEPVLGALVVPQVVAQHHVHAMSPVQFAAFVYEFMLHDKQAYSAGSAKCVLCDQSRTAEALLENHPRAGKILMKARKRVNEAELGVKIITPIMKMADHCICVPVVVRLQVRLVVGGHAW